MSQQGPSSPTLPDDSFHNDGHDGGHGPDASGDHGHEAHGSSLKTYISVFVALCLLTTLSFMTYTDFWRTHFNSDAGRHMGWALMMAVSCSKALLVILFFMHLKHEANWKYVLTIPAGFMSIFLVLMLVPDVGRRFWTYSNDRLKYCAELPETHPAPPPPVAGKPK